MILKSNKDIAGLYQFIVIGLTNVTSIILNIGKALKYALSNSFAAAMYANAWAKFALSRYNHVLEVLANVIAQRRLVSRLEASEQNRQRVAFDYLDMENFREGRTSTETPHLAGLENSQFRVKTSEPVSGQGSTSSISFPIPSVDVARQGAGSKPFAEDERPDTDISIPEGESTMDVFDQPSVNEWSVHQTSSQAQPTNTVQPSAAEPIDAKIELRRAMGLPPDLFRLSPRIELPGKIGFPPALPQIRSEIPANPETMSPVITTALQSGFSYSSMVPSVPSRPLHPSSGQVLGLLPRRATGVPHRKRRRTVDHNELVREAQECVDRQEVGPSSLATKMSKRATAGAQNSRTARLATVGCNEAFNFALLNSTVEKLGSDAKKNNSATFFDKLPRDWARLDESRQFLALALALNH